MLNNLKKKKDYIHVLHFILFFSILLLNKGLSSEFLSLCTALCEELSRIREIGLKLESSEVSFL